jgi:hypothetical protein
VALVLVDDELDEYFVVYKFNFVHMSVVATAGFLCDVCMNLTCLPFVSNLGCVWYGSNLQNHLVHFFETF